MQQQPPQYIIFGNGGNGTVAAMQCCHEQNIQNITVVTIDTGWSEVGWDHRMHAVTSLAQRYHFQVKRLVAAQTFTEAIEDRMHFPSKQFQWCAGLFKGVTLLDWLDKVDLRLTTVVIMGKHAFPKKLGLTLREYDMASEYFGGRQVWLPLYATSQAARDELIKRAGFTILPHRSLECSPCIHNTGADFALLQPKTIERVAALEEKIGQTMFRQAIGQMVTEASSCQLPSVEVESIDLGCGAPFGCGL